LVRAADFVSGEIAKGARYEIGGTTFVFQIPDPLIAEETDRCFKEHRSSSAASGADYSICHIPRTSLPALKQAVHAGDVVHESFLYPDVPFHVTWKDGQLGFWTWGERYALYDTEASTAVFCSEPSRNEGRFFSLGNTLLMPLVNEMLARRRKFFMHCGCIALDGRSILIGAASGGGKTTSVLALVAAGFQFVSDDVTILDVSGPQIEFQAFRRDVRILPDTLDLLPELKHLQHRPLRDGKIETDAGGVAASGVCDRAPAGLLLVPEATDDKAQPEYEALSAADALERFIPHALFISGAYRYQYRMDALIDLVNSVPAYRLRPRLAPSRIPEIVRELLNVSSKGAI